MPCRRPDQRSETGGKYGLDTQRSSSPQRAPCGGLRERSLQARPGPPRLSWHTRRRLDPCQRLSTALAAAATSGPLHPTTAVRCSAASLRLHSDMLAQAAVEQSADACLGVVKHHHAVSGEECARNTHANSHDKQHTSTSGNPTALLACCWCCLRLSLLHSLARPSRSQHWACLTPALESSCMPCSPTWNHLNQPGLST